MDKIDTFIRRLSQIETQPTLTNIYAATSAQNEICINNLSLYLHRIMNNNSHVILVGEAPGWHGCRLSGIPFTCEDMFTQEWIPDIMGKKLEYRTVSEGILEREGSALVVWRKMKDWYNKYQSVPLLWNVCPFHPHEEGNDNTNRRPRASELALGKPILDELLCLFEIEYIGAIGKEAEKAISKMGKNVFPIRHPSRGGASLCACHIEQFMNTIEI